jgi:D-aminopeptidase
MLKEEFANALTRPRAQPFVLKGPLHLELEMTTYVAAETLAYLPNLQRQGAFSVSTTVSSIEMAVRFIAFAMFYSPTGVPPI